MSEFTAADIPEAFRRDWTIIASSGRFDAGWYLRCNPDVAAAGVDPLLHYIEHGAKEGRDPNRSFASTYYLHQNADVAAAGMNPLVHYVMHGEQEGRTPFPDGLQEETSEPSPSAGLFRPVNQSDFELRGVAPVVEYMLRTATPLDRAAVPRTDEYSPTISLILPVYNTAPGLLREVIHSIRTQTYDRWELCIVDDCSTSAATVAVLEELVGTAGIVMSRLPVNSGIAAASHAALMMATGDYVGFVDHDDVLVGSALSEVVAVLREDRSIDYIYSDHAMIDASGVPRYAARKPGWSPEFLLSTNYIVHFKIVRRSLLIDIGGLQHERPNVQDLGMSLRLLSAGAKVRHLDKILYLWREHAGSVASGSAAKEGIERHLIAAYDDFHRRGECPVSHFWPRRFRLVRTGVFAIDFQHVEGAAALVVLVDDDDDSPVDAVEQRLGALAGHGLPIVAISRKKSSRRGLATRWLRNEDEERRFFAELQSDHLILCRASARCVSPVGWRNLAGYLSLDRAIGMVGAKTLDERLSVTGGGMLLDRTAKYRLIAGGESDVASGHWFTAQVASNVDAISSSCFAVRRSLLVDGPGLQWHRFGRMVDVALSQAVAASGDRIVFDPAVKMVERAGAAVDAATLRIVEAAAVPLARRRLLREF